MSNNIASKIYATSFMAFVEKALHFKTGERLDRSQKYLDMVAHAVRKFDTDDIHNLLVNLPGRHLKTFTCSICLPAFSLGHDDRLSYMIVTNNETLTEDITGQILEIMTSAWYKAAFQTRLSKRHARQADFLTTGGGRVRAVGVNNLTGKGAKRIIIDDAHNVHDWDNERRKQKVIEAFEVLMTRGDAGANTKFLAVGHRVAEDDLSAHIMRRGGFGHLALPMFAPTKMHVELLGKTLHLEKGEALRPNDFPPDHIEKLIRHHRGAPFWLYHQQGLAPPDDDMRLAISDFPISHARLGDIRATGAPIVLSVDPAQSTNSGSQNVIHAYLVNGDQFLLLRAFAEKCSFKRLLNKIKYFVNALGAAAIIIENTARGPDLIENLSGGSIPVLAINPRGTKSDRLRECTPIIKAKRISMLSNQGNEDAIGEIVAYPNGPNDDHVDALTNLLVGIPRLNLRPRTYEPPTRSLGIAIATHRDAPRSSVPGIGLALGQSIFNTPSSAGGSVGFALASRQPTMQPTVNGRSSLDAGPSRIIENALGLVKIREGWS